MADGAGRRERDNRGMAGTALIPRLVIDYEQGAGYGDATGSVRVFTELAPTFTRFREIWLFHRPAAAMVRGFYYPLSAPDRYGIPRAQGPRMVLIDNQGDQLWLSGVGCGEQGARTDGAMTVLTAVWPDLRQHPTLADLHSAAEMQVLEGIVVSSRLLTDPAPVAPPGKTFVHAGRFACRMEYDKEETSPQDLRELWAQATETHGWLGRPTSLTLYDNRAHSELAGHEGCHLIATGESGRELWLQFPEPDTFDRLSPGAARVRYTGAFTEYESIKASIFRAVGLDIDPPDDRPWRDRILGRHRVQPAVVHWP